MMKIIKKCSISTLLLSLLLALVFPPTFAEAVPVQEPQEQSEDNAVRSLYEAQYDFSSLNGIWVCEYRSEHGYVEPQQLQIEIRNAGMMSFEGGRSLQTVTVSHNLNEIWEAVSDRVNVEYQSGEFPVLENRTGKELTYVIEIPVAGFLSGTAAVISISKEEAAYSDPEMSSATLSKLLPDGSSAAVTDENPEELDAVTPTQSFPTAIVIPIIIAIAIVVVIALVLVLIKKKKVSPEIEHVYERTDDSGRKMVAIHTTDSDGHEMRVYGYFDDGRPGDSFEDSTEPVPDCKKPAQPNVEHQEESLFSTPTEI